jgi:hypothetical protein
MNKPRMEDKVYYSLKGLYFACVSTQRFLIANNGANSIGMRELATIKFSGVRRLGHSSAVARLVNEFKLMSAVVLPNSQAADSFVRYASHLYRNIRFSKYTVADCMDGRVIYGEPLDIVMVDNTSYYSQDEISAIYRAFEYSYGEAIRNNKTFFWMFVG